MGHFLMEEDMWFALSDIFVDNEVDYKFIASKLKDTPHEVIKKTLFYKLAPLYGSVYFTPVPQEWIGFDRADVILKVKKHMNKYNNNKTYRLKINILGAFYSLFLNDVWKELKLELEKHNNQFK